MTDSMNEENMRNKATETLPPYKLDMSKLKGGHTGMMLTESLFKERSKFKYDKTLFTMAEQDDMTKGFHSFYRLYMEIGDMTEYEQAMQLLGSTQHWERLCRCPWFKPFLKKCRTDLKNKERSKAIEQIKVTAMNTDSDSIRLQALKFLAKEGVELLDKEPKSTAKTGRGRPTNAEKEGELKRISVEEKELQDDYERVLGKQDV